MSVGRICVRVVHCARPDESVREAARRMARADVGTLVIVDPPSVPVGIVTDRDLMRSIASGLDPDRTRLEVVMGKPVLTIDEAASIEEGLSRMASHEVRRLVVTDAQGPLVGVLSMDDVLELLAEELTTVGKLVSRRKRRALVLGA
jgi:CBS domain-containing protein